MILGLIVWASCFAALYAVLSIGCHTSLPGLTVWLTVIWLAHLAVISGLGLHCWRLWVARPLDTPAHRTFAIAVAGLVNASAAVATLWVGTPILALPPCT